MTLPLHLNQLGAENPYVVGLRGVMSASSSSNPSFGRPRLPGQGRLLAPLLLLLAHFFGTARGVILRPFEDATGADVALVVLAGANVPAARYVPLGRTIQKALVADGLRLWVGIPDEDMVSGRHSIV